MKSKLLLIGLLLPSLALAQNSSTDVNDLRLRKEQLQADLAKLDRETKRNDSLAKFEQEAFAAQKVRFQGEISKRKAELSALQQRLAGIRAESQREQARESQAKIQVESWEARLKFFQQSLEKEARALESLIQSSLPWQKETRLDRVRALIRDLQAGTASAEEGFGRLRSMYDEEIRFGDEVVLADQSVTRNNGALVNVKLLRLGNATMMYVDADHKFYGILQRKGPGQYVWLEDLDLKQRELVRRAVEVKGGKLPPELSSLPFWTTTSTPVTKEQR